MCVVYSCLKLLEGFFKSVRESAHGQCETGAPSEKTGAGYYFKLTVRILRRSSQGFFLGDVSPLV